MQRLYLSPSAGRGIWFDRARPRYAYIDQQAAAGSRPTAARATGHYGGYDPTTLSTAVVWVAGCCVLLAVLHRFVVADFVLIAAIGFVLLAALPVMLELAERRIWARPAA
jgi:hypothetical protein